MLSALSTSGIDPRPALAEARGHPGERGEQPGLSSPNDDPGDTIDRHLDLPFPRRAEVDVVGARPRSEP
jgi:hypothetical protein